MHPILEIHVSGTYEDEDEALFEGSSDDSEVLPRQARTEERSGEVVAGVFYEPRHGVQINGGLATSLSSEADPTAKTALVWLFR